MDRDRMREMLEEVVAGHDPDLGAEMVEQASAMLSGAVPTMGSPGDVITTRVDVTPWLDKKRAAMQAHASQIGADSWFLSMPAVAFARAFGVEAFIRRGAAAGTAEDDLSPLGAPAP
jgi:LmbE family N-acetylglucosaminyl deacetylase